MSKIPQAEYDAVGQEARALWDEQVNTHGRMTNMKRTLAHSGPALRSFMEWYPLKDEVAAVVGERPAILFAHAISSEVDCLICSTFFRRLLVQWGEDPDNLQLNPEEQLLVNLGRAMVKDANNVPQQYIQQLKEAHGDSFVVNLIAFGGVMMATNLFNNVLQIPLDEYLYEYKKPE